MTRKIVWNYISEADLEYCRDWNPNIPKEKPRLFLRMLYLLGADPTQKWEEETLTHRTRVTGEIVTTKRYAFVERRDKDWLNSGLASLEAIMADYE